MDISASNSRYTGLVVHVGSTRTSSTRGLPDLLAGRRTGIEGYDRLNSIVLGCVIVDYGVDSWLASGT